MKAVDKFEIPSRLQILDLCDHGGIRQAITRSIADQGTHHPYPGAHDRDHQQDEPHLAPDLQETEWKPMPPHWAVKLEMPEDKIRKILKSAKGTHLHGNPGGVTNDDSHPGDFIEDANSAGSHRSCGV